MSHPLIYTPSNGAAMLDTPKAIQACFQQCLDRANEVHIAVAWARPGWAIQRLERAKIKVHALVGTAFDMTHPDALESLMRLKGNVRVTASNAPLFHPKLYLFDGDHGCDALIGSVNLTAGAFLANHEAAIHLRLDKPHAKLWLESLERWSMGSSRVTATWLKEYRSTWRDPKSGVLGQVRSAEDLESTPAATFGTGVKLLELLAEEWPDYERRLRKAAARFDGDVLGSGNESYITTLRLVTPIIRGPIPAASAPEFLRLMGRRPRSGEPNCGYFGNSGAGGNAMQQLGNNTSLRSRISQLMPAVLSASTHTEVLSAGRELFRAMTSFRGVSHGVATRLLTIARPDRFFSVNTASSAGLGALFGVPVTSLQRWEKYAAVLQQVWEAP